MAISSQVGTRPMMSRLARRRNSRSPTSCAGVILLAFQPSSSFWLITLVISATSGVFATMIRWTFGCSPLASSGFAGSDLGGVLPGLAFCAEPVDTRMNTPATKRPPKSG